MKNKNGSVSVSVRVICKCHPISSGSPAHRNKNLIRILESFVILPAIAVSMPLGGFFGSSLAKTDPSIDASITSPKIALAQQPNLDISNLLSFKKAEVKDEKAELLKVQAEAIDAYFKAYNMPLNGTGMKFAEEAAKNELDWRLLPAIAVRESTGGKHACKKVKNSFFGWGGCKINFESKEIAIEVVARNLGGNNPNTDHHYTKGKSVKEILQKYNPPSIIPHYAAEVMAIMEAIGDQNLGKVPTEKVVAVKA